MVGLSDLPVELLRFGYAILIFIESSKWFKSQANDILDVEITLLNAKTTLRKIFDHEILSATSKKKHKLKKIIFATNQANGVLRVVGFLPLFLLSFGVLFGMGIDSQIFVESSINPMLAKYFLNSGTLLLVIYVSYKFYLKIPVYLIDLHPKYKDKSILKVLMNIYPLW